MIQRVRRLTAVSAQMVPRLENLLAKSVLGDPLGNQFRTVNCMVDVATIKLVAFNREIHDLFGQLLDP